MNGQDYYWNVQEDPCSYDPICVETSPFGTCSRYEKVPANERAWVLCANQPPGVEYNDNQNGNTLTTTGYCDTALFDSSFFAQSTQELSCTRFKIGDCNIIPFGRGASGAATPNWVSVKLVQCVGPPQSILQQANCDS